MRWFWGGGAYGLIGESGALLRDAGIWRDMINEHATDPENARRLWGVSEGIVGEKFDV